MSKYTVIGHMLTYIIIFTILSFQLNVDLLFAIQYMFLYNNKDTNRL